MNDFLIKEITNIYDDVQKGHSNTYTNGNTARQDLSKALGRIETIISLLENKTIVIKYKEGENK